MVRVILIDTGLADDYVDSRILGGCSVTESETGFFITEGYKDYIGHGTATADIILKYSQNVEIYVVRIYEEELFVAEEKLCFALEYVREHLVYDILQISSGLLVYSQRMHMLIKQIVNEDRKFVISAFDNEGGMSYPAAFKEVFGIDVNPSYHKKDEFDIIENGVIDLRGGDVFFRVPWINGRKNIVKGTSFLTSYFTAWIGECCTDGLSKESVCNKLKERAISVYSNDKEEFYDSTQFVKGIKRAIAFPFNKEIYCLAAFEDMLPFEIEGYYDIKHKFIVGKKIKEILKYTDNDAVIKNVDTINWDGDFDTVICGHLAEISQITKKNYLMEILSLCQKHHKRAYILDDLGTENENYRNTKMLFSPIIPVNQYLHNHFGKLRMCNKPVLAVLGTSSRQGKYTIQLELMREFRKRDIRIDGIATEPTGALFGFSEMYACGYGSNNFLSGREMISVLNDMVFRLESKDVELIITGGQSGTIAYDMRNESLVPIEQSAYLYGVNPDGVILCVNEFDDFRYVKRTINFIESISCANVFAIVVSPAHNDLGDFAQEKGIIEKLNEEYGNDKKVHQLQTLDVAALADDVMHYYD